MVNLIIILMVLLTFLSMQFFKFCLFSFSFLLFSTMEVSHYKIKLFNKIKIIDRLVLIIMFLDVNLQMHI